jgi:hypothetical protein
MLYCDSASPELTTLAHPEGGAWCTLDEATDSATQGQIALALAAFGSFPRDGLGDAVSPRASAGAMGLFSLSRSDDLHYETTRLPGPGSARAPTTRTTHLRRPLGLSGSLVGGLGGHDHPLRRRQRPACPPTTATTGPKTGDGALHVPIHDARSLDARRSQRRHGEWRRWTR